MFFRCISGFFILALVYEYTIDTPYCFVALAVAVLAVDLLNMFAKVVYNVE